MARNKVQGQQGLNEGRQDNLDENKRSNLKQDQSQEDLQSGNSRKGGKIDRRGGAGKNNGQ